jgi:class 3 adenylate cyclase
VDQPPGSADFYQKIMAMLFADVVGYSRLTDEQIPYFVEHLVADVAQLINQSLYQPVMKNTWGDALFMVFDHLEDAGKLALDICDLMNNTDWPEKHLPDHLNLRIALHAGPVYSCTDPVTGLRNYFGSPCKPRRSY